MRAAVSRMGRWRLRSSLVAAAVGCLTLSVAPSVYAETVDLEPNNSPATASGPIGLAPIAGVLGAVRDKDIYFFRRHAGGPAQLTITSSQRCRLGVILSDARGHDTFYEDRIFPPVTVPVPASSVDESGFLTITRVSAPGGTTCAASKSYDYVVTPSASTAFLPADRPLDPLSTVGVDATLRIRSPSEMVLDLTCDPTRQVNCRFSGLRVKTGADDCCAFAEPARARRLALYRQGIQVSPTGVQVRLLPVQTGLGPSIPVALPDVVDWRNSYEVLRRRKTATLSIGACTADSCSQRIDLVPTTVRIDATGAERPADNLVNWGPVSLRADGSASVLARCRRGVRACVASIALVPRARNRTVGSGLGVRNVRIHGGATRVVQLRYENDAGTPASPNPSDEQRTQWSSATRAFGHVAAHPSGNNSLLARQDYNVRLPLRR